MSVIHVDFRPKVPTIQKQKDTREMMIRGEIVRIYADLPIEWIAEACEEAAKAVQSDFSYLEAMEAAERSINYSKALQARNQI